MILRACLLFFVITFILHGFAQVRQLHFVATFDKQKLRLEEGKYTTSKGDSMSVDVLKFYISNLELLKNKVIVRKCTQAYYLVDFSNEKSTTIKLPNDNSFDPDEIRFDIGIDSITNYSGALGGNLDPTLGMYWTWQNGYVNFKLEGKSTACISQNKKFEFHIGGYNYPFSTLQEIVIPVHSSDDILIEINIRKLFDFVDLSKLHHIMSPCKDAVELSKQFPFIFTVAK